MENMENYSDVFREIGRHTFYTAMFFLVPILWVLAAVFIVTAGNFPIMETVKMIYEATAFVATMAFLFSFLGSRDNLWELTESQKKIVLTLTLIPAIRKMVRIIKDVSRRWRKG